MLVFVEGCCGDPARSGAPRRDFSIGVSVWGVPRDRQDGGCKVEFTAYFTSKLARTCSEAEIATEIAPLIQRYIPDNAQPLIESASLPNGKV
jgi:hypothetical protein